MHLRRLPPRSKSPQKYFPIDPEILRKYQVKVKADRELRDVHIPETGNSQAKLNFLKNKEIDDLFGDLDLSKDHFHVPTKPVCFQEIGDSVSKCEKVRDLFISENKRSILKVDSVHLEPTITRHCTKIKSNRPLSASSTENVKVHQHTKDYLLNPSARNDIGGLKLSSNYMTPAFAPVKRPCIRPAIPTRLPSPSKPIIHKISSNKSSKLESMADKGHRDPSSKSTKVSTKLPSSSISNSNGERHSQGSTLNNLLRDHDKRIIDPVDDDSDHNREWRSILRRLTGYDPNDTKFKIRDSYGDIIESSFSQMTVEESNSRRRGIVEDRIELEKELGRKLKKKKPNQEVK